MTAQYETITLGVNDLDRIKLPKFQRGFVWNKSKKNEFVQTLHDGFPFGALLVYPETSDSDSKLLLLDGQQRLSTIKQYKENPLPFWKPLNMERYKNCLAQINEQLSEEFLLDEKAFDELLTGKRDEADWADEVQVNSTVRKQLRDRIKELRRDVAKYIDLDELGILAIKFTGSKERIADVFANLNKGGMPLSKYEIYSAAWINTEIQLLGAGESGSGLQDEILELVKSYYKRMENVAEFDLNEFSEDELTKERAITLSEFGTALGAYVVRHLPSLVPDTQSSQNEIGFGLLGIVTGTDNRQLNTLNEHLDYIKGDLQLILEKTSRICKDLNGAFTKLLNRLVAGKDDEYPTGLSATFKTLSYFAALWDLDPNSNEYATTLKNIPSYYVYDFWARSWTSHGDQRLLDYYPKFAGKRSYLQKLTSEQMMDAYMQWSSDTTPGINFPKEVKALTTIQANLSYLSKVLSHGETFELEHVIAKKLVNASDDANDRKILASSLGNCMYLPKQINNKKKEKNLYEVNENGKYDAVMKDSFYFTEAEFETISIALEDKSYETVNELIARRGTKLAQNIIDMLLKQ